MIDLRSDTFTLPTAEMREHIAGAEVGDDYYGEDESVNRLENYCKELFGKEDAIFTTSGMLANQLGVISQTSRGNEVVTEYNYHINLYESAQHATFCHVVMNGRETADGVLRVADVERAVKSKPREATYAQVDLVSIENTINHRQGKVFPFDELKNLRAYTRREGIYLHMDGARIFHAHIVTGIPLDAYASEVDTLSVCFSKGLGAPFGSMLLGRRDVIERARRFRVWYGSGFHQIGIYAEAAHFALTRQLDSLAEDHRLTRLLAERLSELPALAPDLSAVETNMIFINLAPLGLDVDDFEKRCRQRGLLLCGFPPQMVRLVVNRNVNEAEVREAAEILLRVGSELLDARRPPAEPSASSLHSTH